MPGLPCIIIIKFHFQSDLGKVVSIVITIIEYKTKNQKGSFSLFNQLLLPSNLREEEKEEEE